MVMHCIQASEGRLIPSSDDRFEQFQFLYKTVAERPLCQIGRPLIFAELSPSHILNLNIPPSLPLYLYLLAISSL